MDSRSAGAAPGAEAAAGCVRPKVAEGECSVCRDEFEAQETIHLGCGHMFHTVCMQEWYKHQHPCKCPLCRADVDVESARHYDDKGEFCRKHKDWDRVKEEADAAHASSSEMFMAYVVGWGETDDVDDVRFLAGPHPRSKSTLSPTTPTGRSWTTSSCP
jgi:hypothetical protein